MSDPMKIPEACRVSLLALFHAAKQAEREYNIALNHTVAAIGLNPNDNHQVNLDTGEIVLAVKE